MHLGSLKSRRAAAYSVHLLNKRVAS